MTSSEALIQLQTAGVIRHAAWRYMRNYHGQTPYHGFLVFHRGRMYASSVSFSPAEWQALNDAMWALQVEQQPLFNDLSAQPALFPGGRK